MFTKAEISALLLSLRVAVCAVVLVVPPGVLVAWVLAKSRMRGKSLLDTLVSLPLVLPPVVTGYLLLMLMSRNGPLGRVVQSAFGVELRIVFTWYAAVIASAIVSFPLFVRTVTVAFGAVDPRLEDTARSLGAGRIRTFFTITLPLAGRGLVAGLVLAFARSLGEFGATVIVAGNIPGMTQTIPLAVFNLYQTGKDEMAWRLIGVATAVAFVALFIVWWLTKRGEKKMQANGH